MREFCGASFRSVSIDVKLLSGLSQQFDSSICTVDSCDFIFGTRSDAPFCFCRSFRGRSTRRTAQPPIRMKTTSRLQRTFAASSKTRIVATPRFLRGPTCRGPINGRSVIRPRPANGLEHGYNGAFVNRSDTGVGDSPTGRLDWIDQFHLRFYVDHTASKGYLHLWDGDEMLPHAAAVHGNGVRTPPVNDAMRQTLEHMIRGSIDGVKRSPNRAAYALDDEISWGHFIHPCMWCVTDDKAAYAKWLSEIYGPNPPKRESLDHL